MGVVVTETPHAPHERRARGVYIPALADMFPNPSPRRRPLFVLIVGATLVPIAALVWLGWRLLEQDPPARGPAGSAAGRARG